MDLDPGLLGSAEELADMDVVDVVARDCAKSRSKAANDARLFAVGDVVVSHQMMTNFFLGPSCCVSAFNGFHVAFGGIGGGVVELVAVFTERNSGASRVTNGVIFDNPSLAPMSAN